MSAYLVGQIQIKNDVLWQQYLAGVKESLTPYDATVEFRGKLVEVLSGHSGVMKAGDSVVIIKFADYDNLNRWYHSKVYQALIPVRDLAADINIFSYED